MWVFARSQNGRRVAITKGKEETLGSDVMLGLILVMASQGFYTCQNSSFDALDASALFVKLTVTKL